MMKDREWQEVPGAPGARIFPFIRKPDVVCCNSYIIEVPGQLIVIDPGADPKQMGEILRTLEDVGGSGHDRVTFYLTHCHVDHCYCLVEGKGITFPEGSAISAHSDGVRAIRDFDNEVTQARMMGWDFPPREIHLKLRPLLSDESTEGTVLQSTQMQELLTPGGLRIDYQTIPLSDGLELIAYHTPGHSPDSVCYQIGRFLITGDLLFATDLGIIGIVGWDRDAMESSILKAKWLLDEKNIELCLPGHGYCLEPAKARTILDRMAKDVKGIGILETKDAERVNFTSKYALDLLDETNDNFSIIAGRLYYLAYQLEELEEGSEARKYLDLLEHDRIDEMLTSFNRFVEEFYAGRKIQLQVTMKAVQTMNNINAIFKGSDLEAILDRSLIAGTSRLLVDFMSAVKGIELDVDKAECDLGSLVGEIVGDQTVRPTDDLMDCLDDPARYASLLARRIAHIPVFDDIDISLEGEGSAVVLDRKRFQDSLSGIMLDLAGAEAKSIRLHLEGKELRIEADISLSQNMGEKKIRALKRRFELAGASFAVNGGAPWSCVIGCDEFGDSR